MAQKTRSQLTTSINTNIKSNGNQDITGPVLNGELKDIIDSALLREDAYTKAEVDGLVVANSTLSGLTDVSLTNPIANDLLKYNGSVWVNTGDTTYKNTGGDITGNVRIFGNLTISGTTTFVNTNDLNISDNIILINSGETGAGVSKRYAGIHIDRGSQPDYLIQFDEVDDKLYIGVSGSTTSIPTVQANTGSLLYYDGTTIKNIEDSTYDLVNDIVYFESGVVIGDVIGRGIEINGNLDWYGGAADANFDGNVNLYNGALIGSSLASISLESDTTIDLTSTNDITLSSAEIVLGSNVRIENEILNEMFIDTKLNTNQLVFTGSTGNTLYVNQVIINDDTNRIHIYENTIDNVSTINSPDLINSSIQLNASDIEVYPQTGRFYVSGKMELINNNSQFKIADYNDGDGLYFGTSDDMNIQIFNPNGSLTINNSYIGLSNGSLGFEISNGNVSMIGSAGSIKLDTSYDLELNATSSGGMWIGTNNGVTITDSASAAYIGVGGSQYSNNIFLSTNGGGNLQVGNDTSAYFSVLSPNGSELVMYLNNDTHITSSNKLLLTSTSDTEIFANSTRVTGDTYFYNDVYLSTNTATTFGRFDAVSVNTNGKVSVNRTPHAWLAFSGLTHQQTITTAWSTVTNSAATLFDDYNSFVNMTHSGDSIKIQYDGHYSFNYHLVIASTNGVTFSCRLWNRTRNLEIPIRTSVTCSGAGNYTTIGNTGYMTNVEVGDEVVLQLSADGGTNTVDFAYGSIFCRMNHGLD